MLEMFTANDTSLILLVVLGAITVFYILTDGNSNNCSKSENTETKPKEKEEQVKPIDNGKIEDVAEDFKKKPPVKEVERRQKVNTASSVNTGVIEQTDEYKPSSSAPLPKIKSVTTTTTIYETAEAATPVTPVTPVAPSEEISGNLKLEDFEEEQEQEIVCQWCDYVVKMKKGSTMVCPRCTGTIEG